MSSAASPGDPQPINLQDHIRSIPDFPKPGILFYDISTLLRHPAAWRATVENLADLLAPFRPDLLVGIESRGFLVAAPLAYRLGIGFAMVRKLGKLPGETTQLAYGLEYGNDHIEMQTDALQPGQRVAVLDDLLATGGTMAATVTLARRCGAEVVAAACIVELEALGGRSKLDLPFFSLVKYND